MLRVFTFDEPFTLKLRLEGALDSSSLSQHEAALSSARGQRGDRRLLVDVKDLTVTDSAGEQALLAARRRDIHFVGAVNRIAELLLKEEESECRQRCSLLRKIGFSLTEHCRASARPFCMKLYRLLHSEE